MRYLPFEESAVAPAQLPDSDAQTFSRLSSIPSLSLHRVCTDFAATTLYLYLFALLT